MNRLLEVFGEGVWKMRRRKWKRNNMVERLIVLTLYAFRRGGEVGI